MLSSELEGALNEAFQKARAVRHEFVTVEHLLAAILVLPKIGEILRACAANLPALRRDLREFIDQTTPCLPNGDAREVQPTVGFQRVLQRAVFYVQSSGKGEVTAANVLVTIFSEKHSHAVYLLSVQGVQRLDVVNYIGEGLSESAASETAAGLNTQDLFGLPRLPLSMELKSCIGDALQHACELRHEKISVEHLLHAITGMSTIHASLRDCSVDVGRLRDDLSDFMNHMMPRRGGEDVADATPTQDLRLVVERAQADALSRGATQVTCHDVLVSILGEEHCAATYLLSRQNVVRLDTFQRLRQSLPGPPDTPPTG